VISVDAFFNSRLAAALRFASAANFLILAGDFFAIFSSTFLKLFLFFFVDVTYFHFSTKQSNKKN
jgi:hypothetical protein